LIEGRKTVLTEAGRMILRRSDYLLEEAKKVEDIGLTLSQGIESHLKIAVDEVLPRTLLYQALEQVSEKFPTVQIELLESILSGANEMLDKDDVEIAISPNSLGAGLSEHLCAIKFGAVVTPDHPLSKIDRNLTLQDLKKFRQIVVRDSSTSNNKEKANDGWLKANQRWTVSHMQSSIDMVSKGLGFAWLPLNLIQDKLENNALIPLPLDGNSERSVSLYLTFKDLDALGPVAQDFITTIKSLCAI